MNQDLPTTTDKPSKAASELQRLADVLAAGKLVKGTSLWADGWKRLKRNRVSMVSLWILIAIGSVAIFTPALPLQSPILQDVKHRELLPPQWTPYSLNLVQPDEKINLKQSQLNALDSGDPSRKALVGELESLKSRQQKNCWNDPGFISRVLIKLRISVFGDYCIPSVFGTDKLGRDILSRVCWGSRVSLACGLVATMVSLVIGVSYGAIAGYFGGRIDNLMMRIIDVGYSVPFIFIVIFIMSFLSAPQVRDQLLEWGISQITLFFVMIGAIYWLTMARVVRGQGLSLKNEQFVEAARTIGTSRFGIIFRHLIPNVMGIVIVYLTLTIPAVIRFEAFLSFLGMGVQAPDISWGMLVNEGIQVITPIRIYWWMIVFSGFALALTLFALNFLGDGVRDALDPKLKNR